MRAVYLLIAITALLSLDACVTKPKPNYSKFFEHHPRSILIVPPMNQTTAVEAPAFFTTTVSRPFAERGYYVFPVFLTRDILNDMGLSDEGLLLQFQPQRFRETFGADAVLFVTIKQWVTTYIFLASSVTVEAIYKLVDTDSGEVIWEKTQLVVQQSGGQGIAGMIANAIITALTVDYRPLAQRANIEAVRAPREGLPTGPYATGYQIDYSSYRDEPSIATPVVVKE